MNVSPHPQTPGRLNVTREGRRHLLGRRPEVRDAGLLLVGQLLQRGGFAVRFVRRHVGAVLDDEQLEPSAETVSWSSSFSASASRSGRLAVRMRLHSAYALATSLSTSMSASALIWPPHCVWLWPICRPMNGWLPCGSRRAMGPIASLMPHSLTMRP